MRNLLLSSLAVLFLSACTFGHYGRLKEVDHAYATAPKPIFGDNFNSFLFKTNIHVYGRDFSGLLVTKQMSPNDYRVIFTTELGMKMFDFEFRDTAFTLHYCMPQFNKPKLLKVIQVDIQTLLMNDLAGKKFDYYTDAEGKYWIHKFSEGKTADYYFTEKDSRHIGKIEHAKGRIKKTTFTLSDYQSDFPEKVVIRHHDIRLRIELNHLKKQPGSEGNQ
jgi:hypothetical protein